VSSGRLITKSWVRKGQLRMRVISHTEDDGMGKAIEEGGTGLARIVASTSSQISWVARVGSIKSRGKVDLAMRTTIRTGLRRERGLGG